MIGRLAIGWLRSERPALLPREVNSSGAVSPAMRATPSRMPVMMPEMAARQQTSTIIFHFGAPRPITASRRVFGIRRSMSSVVRTTIGMTMIASATTPAQPEKPPKGSTSSW